MDAKMQGSNTAAGQYQTWDYAVQDGIVPIIEGGEEEMQAAQIAAFIQVGTVPQLPAIGIPWVEFMTGTEPFNAVDSAIRRSLTANGLTNYYPTYDLVNDNLIATVGTNA